VIDVYVLRRGQGCAVEFLQMHRAKGVLSGTWQPVMGHSHEGETAVQTALRELREETGFAPDAPGSTGPLKLLNLWQLEEPNIYFLASLDTIVMGPCFAAEVAGGAEPVLNDEHDAHRWIERAHADRYFLWPGQRKALRQIIDDVLSPDAPSAPLLKITLG
jgi:dATP pyrophosphohydrolase